MKTLLLTTLFVLFCFKGFSQDLKALDTKYGFKEAKLEMPVTSFKNLVPQGSVEETLPNCKLYEVKNVDLHIGSYSLDDIVYWFYKEKLMTIEITVSGGYSNQQGVLKVLQAAYGKGESYKNSYGSDTYNWEGATVEMSYTLGDDVDPTGDIQITCYKLQYLQKDDSILKDQKKDLEIKKAAKEL